MITRSHFAIPIVLAFVVCAAWGQPPAGRPPHIGYLYPAGAQQGSVVQITAGGQALAGAKDVYISGDGVTGSEIQFVRPLNNQQLRSLGAKLKERRAQLEAKGAPKTTVTPPPSSKATPPATAKEFVPLPNHPWIQNVDTMTLEDLQRVASLFFDKKKQQNVQIAETVFIEVSVGPAAAPGMRDFRIATAAGLTNPIHFEIGALPETREREPNDPRPLVAATPGTDIELPALLNGQIMPGDIDRFDFRARQGQHIVANTRARQLVPYLADAVPGWFQAVITLYDGNGREVAYADDDRFDPDPVLAYTIPADGGYTLEIRDALYRGREDFVYRIAVDEVNRAPSEDTPEFAGPLAECPEVEPNDELDSPQVLSLPCTVSGSIGQVDDADVYRFDGRKDDEIVAEVLARRFDSPLDSLLRLTDESGRVLAWNDDHEDAEAGPLVHHADSYLTARLPRNGVYAIELTDAQRHSGQDYRYRLRIGAPRPDYALRIVPSSINVRPGRSAAISAHALRKDGFSGAISLALKGAPPGLTLDGATIPPGVDRIRLTLTADTAPTEHPLALQVEGSAEIDGQVVRRLATPAEDMMQAFIYRHLVPCDELLVSVFDSKGRGRPVEIASDNPAKIPLGGVAQVYVKTPAGLPLSTVKLELSDPPKGISLNDVVIVPDGMVLEVKADADAAKAGLADNLIVEAFTETDGPQRDGKPAKNKRRVSLGVLPAIPIEIAQR